MERGPEVSPRFGLSLLHVHPDLWPEVTVEAERAGFESIWISDHLMLPDVLDSGDYPEGDLPIAPDTPIIDVMVQLAALAAMTTTIRLGTYV